MVIKNIAGTVVAFKKEYGVYYFHPVPVPSGVKQKWVLCAENIVPNDVKRKLK